MNWELFGYFLMAFSIGMFLGCHLTDKRWERNARTYRVIAGRSATYKVIPSTMYYGDIFNRMLAESEE